MDLRVDIQCRIPYFDRSQSGEYIKRHLTYAGATRDIFSEAAGR
jgi:general secretion pathway protein A